MDRLVLKCLRLTDTRNLTSYYFSVNTFRQEFQSSDKLLSLPFLGPSPPLLFFQMPVNFICKKFYFSGLMYSKALHLPPSILSTLASICRTIARAIFFKCKSPAPNPPITSLSLEWKHKLLASTTKSYMFWPPLHLTVHFLLSFFLTMLHLPWFACYSLSTLSSFCSRAVILDVSFCLDLYSSVSSIIQEWVGSNHCSDITSSKRPSLNYL